MISNSLSQRASDLKILAKDRFDVLVIGGGIVGSGIARDAAMRGLRTALVEQHDFAFGTSSRSSRLLHGGLRYLEQGRIGLVREASVEKKTIHRIAPHLALPLGFAFPAYRPEGRPLWQLRIGVKLYDLLCSGRNFEASSVYSASETHKRMPDLKTENLRGSVRYFDALTNDARLVLDTLRSAHCHDATLVNYLRFDEAQCLSGGWSCKLTDQLGGASLSIKTRTIINATGPWAQGLGHSAVKLRLSKGIHIVVDRDRIPIDDAVAITEGKRILFVLPWGKRIIIGTTDTDYRGKPEEVRVEESDIQYVLHAVNQSFPRLKLTGNDVVSSWAGLRPLIANPDGTPSDISRAHKIHSPKTGWWDVAGGKLTTYRLMAEQTVNVICKHLHLSTPPSRTAEEPLLPDEQDRRYSGITPVAFSKEAVEHYVRNEWALSIEDVLVRRSGWHYYHRPCQVAEEAEAIANWMAELLGWTAATRDAALAHYYASFGSPPDTRYDTATTHADA